ncbi:MAG: hypothetical protein OXI63_13010 [Candidatus Poribacteria bacterium]|nr:hypothetical protein [Candidatus Poribacteria bacterium]
MKTKILWDLWMIQWLVEMSEPKPFKHYGYFPIDGEPFHPSWTNLIKTMDAVITYSKYGQQLVENATPSVNVDMIYHGVDTETALLETAMWKARGNDARLRQRRTRKSVQNWHVR